MGQKTREQTGTTGAKGYLRAGWTLLVIAFLALAIPIVATAAQPHVVWLFSTSYGAIGMVLGVTLIRVGQKHPGRRTCRPGTLTSCSL